MRISWSRTGYRTVSTAVQVFGRNSWTIDGVKNSEFSIY